MPLHMTIGAEEAFTGVVDLIKDESHDFWNDDDMGMSFDYRRYPCRNMLDRCEVMREYC